MEAYRVKKRIAAKGVLHLDALPLEEGVLAEVIILVDNDKKKEPVPSSIRGKVIEYIDPTEPAAQDDWELLR